MLVRLNTFGEILEGNHFRGHCHISEDPDGDGFCIVVYRKPNRQSDVMLSDWVPTIEDLNTYVRDQNRRIEWST